MKKKELEDQAKAEQEMKLLAEKVAKEEEESKGEI